MIDAADLTPRIMDHVLAIFLTAMQLNKAPMLDEGLWLLGQFARWYLVFASMKLIFGVSLRVISGFMAYAGLKVMIFIFLVANLDKITLAFNDTMVLYGLKLSGSVLTPTDFQQPGRMVAEGIRGLKPLFTYMENQSYLDRLMNWWVVFMYAAICFIALISYIVIGSHIVLAQIEFQVIAVYGVVMVPWGIVGPTAFIAEAAIGGIVTSAVRLGVLAFMMGLINPIILSLAVPAAVLDGKDLPYWHALSAMMGALLLCLLSTAVPNFAASFFGGGPALTGQALIGGVFGMVGGGVRAVRRVTGG